MKHILTRCFQLGGKEKQIWQWIRYKNMILKCILILNACIQLNKHTSAHFIYCILQYKVQHVIAFLSFVIAANYNMKYYKSWIFTPTVMSNVSLVGRRTHTVLSCLVGTDMAYESSSTYTHVYTHVQSHTHTGLFLFKMLCLKVLAPSFWISAKEHKQTRLSLNVSL